MELRQEICNYLHRKFGLGYDAKTQTLATVGANEGIDLALRAIIDKDAEPSFESYKPCVVMAGGTITTKAENQFKLTAKQLQKSIPLKQRI